jgi:hypothetical protein
MMMTSVSLLLMAINSSINFFIYCLVTHFLYIKNCSQSFNRESGLSIFWYIQHTKTAKIYRITEKCIKWP